MWQYMTRMSQSERALSGIALLLVVTGLAGCASTSSVTHKPAVEAQTAARESTKPQSQRALAFAVDMIGTPYRYGGTSPSGFDCSGLVYYSFSKAGMQTARTTKAQYRQTKRVPVADLQAGDLVFFTLSKGTISHVGIYIGEGRFVHAPSSGKRVGYASLNNPYWRSRLSGAGRLQ